MVASKTSRWLRILRCPSCNGFWAEDCLSSANADLFYGYPIITIDPAGWLRQAEPLRLRPW